MSAHYDLFADSRSKRTDDTEKKINPFATIIKLELKTILNLPFLIFRFKYSRLSSKKTAPGTGADIIGTDAKKNPPAEKNLREDSQPVFSFM